MQDLSSLTVDEIEERIALIKECLNIINEIVGDLPTPNQVVHWKENLRILETELFERTVLVPTSPSAQSATSSTPLSDSNSSSSTGSDAAETTESQSLTVAKKISDDTRSN